MQMFWPIFPVDQFHFGICFFAFFADTDGSNVPSPLRRFRVIADREAESVRTVSNGLSLVTGCGLGCLWTFVNLVQLDFLRQRTFKHLKTLKPPEAPSS